jgi:hypothetical protein
MVTQIIVPKSLAISSVLEISLSGFGGERQSALDGLPESAEPLLTILYFLGLHLGSYLMSTIGSTYLTVALLPVRPIYHGTPKHYSIENVL